MADFSLLHTELHGTHVFQYLSARNTIFCLHSPNQFLSGPAPGYSTALPLTCHAALNDSLKHSLSPKCAFNNELRVNKSRNMYF